MVELLLNHGTDMRPRTKRAEHPYGLLRGLARRLLHSCCSTTVRTAKAWINAAGRLCKSQLRGATTVWTGF